MIRPRAARGHSSVIPHLHGLPASRLSRRAPSVHASRIRPWAPVIVMSRFTCESGNDEKARTPRAAPDRSTGMHRFRAPVHMFFHGILHTCTKAGCCQVDPLRMLLYAEYAC